MFERVKNKLTRLRGDSTSEGETATGYRGGSGGENGASPDRGTSSRLFRCLSCETVYIARSKATCGTCGTEVTEVRSTVHDGSNREPGNTLSKDDGD